ncbi:MAG TPA: hypothetical protein VFX51_03710 [Solirubrobacteraceae bacterium]|nr:hypothetical protein [Solirubrobacteraceae bacterium]
MRAADDTPADLLDAWLPDPAVRTHHRRDADADADDLWRAASSLRLSETRTLGRLVRWRIPGLERDLTYGELFRTYPFTVLEEGEHHLLAGLCGRIWTLARDYPRLSGADAFAGWDEPGTVRVLFGHWVEQVDGGAALVSEARVQPTDRSSSMRLKTLWKVIGPFERLVGGEALGAASARSRRA